jgi:hypothetical protein
MDNILIAPKSKKEFDLLTEILKSMRIAFQLEKPYNKEMVKKIEKSRAEYKSGKFKSINTDDLWK